jgi:hypothetical protein
VDTATANPQINVSYGEEAREFLGQSVGFKNEVIGQTNFPLSLRCDNSRAADFFNRRPDALDGVPNDCLWAEYAVNAQHCARCNAGQR